ncbi:hypothetical protein A5784_01485 [Mycobacterium sp. 852013-50091_SCH5140682]|nr:hypothetical protein A5784_01485 [Mycobacterium sp. 852013-50091_SCH5140682]
MWVGGGGLIAFTDGAPPHQRELRVPRFDRHTTADANYLTGRDRTRTSAIGQISKQPVISANRLCTI